MKKSVLWDGINNTNEIIDRIRDINKSNEPINKIISKIIPYLNEFIDSPILDKFKNWSNLYINTIENVISLCLDNFSKRQEKDPKSIEKLFINAFRTIENDTK